MLLLNRYDRMGFRDDVHAYVIIRRLVPIDRRDGDAAMQRDNARIFMMTAQLMSQQRFFIASDKYSRALFGTLECKVGIRDDT